MSERARRVLIVEDEAIVAMDVEDMLQDLGYAPAAVAGRLAEAERLAEEADFEFAILDVNLNGQDTFSLASRLVELGVPFAFATGYGASGLPEKWRLLPILQKPFQKKDLAALLEQAFSGG